MQPTEKVTVTELKLVLTGNDGEKIRRAGNALVGNNVFTDSVPQREEVTVDNLVVEINNTLDLSERYLASDLEEFLDYIGESGPEPPFYLLIIKLQKNNADTIKKTASDFEVMFSKDAWRRTVILLTHQDQTEPDIQMLPQEVKDILAEKVGDGYKVFNKIFDHPDPRLVSDLLNEIVKWNSDVPDLRLHGEHRTDQTCEICMPFYDKYIKLDGDKCARLEELTKMQSASNLWHYARKLRMTASSAKKVPVRSTTKPDNFLREHLFPTFQWNNQENKEKVYALMESEGFVVEKRGTVVSVTEPWLSASPKGVIHSEAEKELLEIVCPILSENCASLADVFRKFTDVKIVNGVPQLQKNGSRRYYLQVQLGMFCTGLKKCKLLFWTESEQKVVDVPYDSDYCTKNITKLKSFYFTHMLPRIVAESQSGRLERCSEYENL